MRLCCSARKNICACFQTSCVIFTHFLREVREAFAKMSGRKCMYGGCKNKASTYDGSFNLHAIPKDTERARVWLSACGVTKSPSKLPLNACVCSIHFVGVTDLQDSILTSFQITRLAFNWGILRGGCLCSHKINQVYVLHYNHNFCLSGVVSFVNNVRNKWSESQPCKPNETCM